LGDPVVGLGDTVIKDGFSSEAVKDGWEQYKKGEPLIEPDQAVGCSARPSFNNPPANVGTFVIHDAAPPLWGKVAIFCGALSAVLAILYLLLHCH
jgi:hypothetical protein